ncbi:MAG TPA: Rieske 2Fe-2S domain-containing protein [Actinocrinis sp.]
MRITSIGHAGLLMETAAGRIVCDPWFTPAYFGSWVPFPDNTGIDPALLTDAEYLYVSHLHRDHFDPDWLSRHMSKDTTVLLPDYPVPDLRDALESLGFRNFVQTRNNEVAELDGGLRILINALTSPTDGPLGDSGLAVDDGRVRVYNQNDSRPVESGPVERFGALHAHFLQYSGAIWYPMVYDFPERMKQTVGTRKRRNGMARALKYVEQYGAKHVFPFAGPPCFLDDDLFHLNDLDQDEANVFPDQFAFLEYAREQERDDVHLFLTGTTVELTPDGGATVEQIPPDEVARIRDDRKGYLLSYKRRVQPAIDAILGALPQDRSDLVGQLREWVQPLIETADHTCAGLNGRILLEASAADGGEDERILFDFLDRRIDAYAGEECRYTFRVARPLVEYLVRRREQDWVNLLFLSCRFEASRKGPYNEYIYTFFKSLSVERMTYVEGYYAESSGVEDYVRADGYVIQRHCPHLKADLVRFGSVKDGVLHCQLHGWEFELATGRCLTSDDRKLVSRPCRTPEDGAEAAEADAGFPEITAETAS